VKLTRDDLVESVSRLQPSCPVTADQVAADLDSTEHVEAIAAALEKLVDEGRLRSTKMFVRSSPRDEFALRRVSYHVPPLQRCAASRERDHLANSKSSNGSVAAATG
jgi:hypothetical protein